MSLEVEQLTKTYAGRAVVQGVSFAVDDGELVALLGPSGSGKSTILRIVAGLVAANAGRVLVDGADVTGLPPRARDLGFVFQNYALFEHMTVADNVEFALRVRGVSRRQRRDRRDELLELVGLGGSARKYPAQLSGGQRQRTALARALAHRPRLLLLDEPFGALDARIRQELRQGLRDLLKQLGTTAVFVTHDQEEAFAVADRIMVLHRGRLLEQGPPQQLYQAPQTEFVASFVGRANLLPGVLTTRGVRLRLGPAGAGRQTIPKRVKALLRPEKLELFATGSEPSPAAEVLSRAACVERIEYLGSSERVHLLVEVAEDGADGRRYRLEAQRSSEDAARLRLRIGDRIGVAARQMHAVTQPSLRLLVVADRDAEGAALVERALSFGERMHAVVTLLGGAVRGSAMAQRLERYRQSFAGDLRLIDPRELGLGVWEAARGHLPGERYDLVLVSAALRDPESTLALLGAPNTGHVLLAAREGDPLAPDESGAHWALLLRGFAASQPDLGLLAELAGAATTRVEVRDLGGSHHHSEVVERSSAALLMRSVAFTVAGTRQQPALEALPEFDPAASLIAADFGPRAGLGPAQSAWLRALKNRWTLLLVQPDESDLSLYASTDFLTPAVAAAGAVRHPAGSEDPLFR